MVAPTVSNNVNEGRMCVRPGDAKDAIEEETTCASLLVSPPFANDTHGSSKTKQGIGEETSESYGKDLVPPSLAKNVKSQSFGTRETCGKVCTLKVVKP